MKKEKVLISVIMPCYNVEAYIKEAIQSVLRQTHQNFELIIVNDGSTDQSAQIIQGFNDERIKYISQLNKGQAAASNHGLKQVRGSYIKFFDADDVMSEEHLEAQLNRIEGKNNCLVSCAWARFYNNDFRSARFKPETVWKDMHSLEWIKSSLAQQYDMMAVWLWLIPKSIIEQTGGWDERLSLNNDFEFSIRLLSNVEKVLFASDAKLYYRTNPNSSLSQMKDKKAFEAAILANELGCSYLLERENSSEMRRICANRLQYWIYCIYPKYSDLVSYLEGKVEELGGSDYLYDGGKAWEFLISMIGWKNAVHLRNLLVRLGYRKLPFN